MPKFSHICFVRTGHELPAKMSVLRIIFFGLKPLALTDTGKLERGKKIRGKFFFRLAQTFPISLDGALCELFICTPPVAALWGLSAINLFTARMSTAC